ncbi:RNA-binding protein [Kocuria sp.]|uniref:RNA-binding protein n=1 Tax=Kocuria sp. TaxID=1871328 RepID=UPI0026E0C89D|nr:RNA-binding protein [Kocuria sp.]MDO5619716.1 RNA-binding protein [Kocuria sp.]
MTTTGPAFGAPEDLQAWRAWQARQQPLLRRARHAIGTSAAPVVHLHHDGGPVHTLVALESLGPTQRAALLEPMRFAPEETGVAYVVPPHVSQELVLGLVSSHHSDSVLPTWARVVDCLPADAPLPAVLRSMTEVLAVGNYLPSGQVAHRWADAAGVRFNVVQHGLLAHQAPPLPRGSHLLAFTDQDAAWWTHGRTDVTTEVVGSQLLWSAAAQSAVRDAGQNADRRPEGPGVFLGQLHGAELPRKDFAAAALQYCRETGAMYRPHPAETDKLSRATHELWRRRGVRIDTSGQSLAAAIGPVASVFSTGVLEAACTGREAWVVHPDPPAWLQEFWLRYGMSRWSPGTPVEPTPALVQPETEPARAVARAIFGSSNGSAQTDQNRKVG